MQDVKQKEETTYFWEDDTLVVYLARELDHHNAEGIKENVDLSVISKGVKRVIFDFSKTVFMDSSGIGLILGRCQQMQARSGHVIIQNPPPHIRRVMRLSGMERIASIEITNV